MVKKSVKKKPVSKKKPGFRPTANVEGGKSYSQVAREVLKRTNGNRRKATEKLRELGCSSASQVVAKIAQGLGYPAQGRVQKKTKTKKPKSKPTKKVTSKKRPVKKTIPKKKLPKRVEEEEFDEELIDDEDILEEDF